MDDAQIANAMKRKGLDIAVEQGRDGWIIVAERDPIRLKRWLDAAGQQKAWLVSEPMDELLKTRARARTGVRRTAGRMGRLRRPIRNFAALTEQWSEDDMRTIHEVEIQYRSALEGVTVREAGCDVQHRCLTDNAELRVEDGKSRTVTGVAVRYGDEARVGSFRERIAKGALKLPMEKANLTMQHDRAMPVGLLEWQDDADALRFRAELTAGPRQDQALMDVRFGLMRGASLEFKPTKEKLLETDETLGPLFEITEAAVIRLSLVDDGAYPQSSIKVRMGQPPAHQEPRLQLDASYRKRDRRPMVV